MRDQIRHVLKLSTSYCLGGITIVTYTPVSVVNPIDVSSGSGTRLLNRGRSAQQI